MNRLSLLLLCVLGCAEAPAPPPASPRTAGPPSPCAIATAPSPGPNAAERAAKKGDPTALAWLFLDEAWQTGDAGFYTLAEAAAGCALSLSPGAVEARRARASVYYNTHRFAEAETEARSLLSLDDNADDLQTLGDALMEQGRLDEAAEAYQRAADKGPNAAIYDRVAWLRWLWGDLDGAIEMERLAVQSSAGQEPRFAAWSLAQLGWFHALRGDPAPELDAALALVPGERHASLFRGRLRLHQGDREGAAADLKAAGTSLDALWALSEIDPSVSVEAHCAADPRTCAMWLAPTQPERALALLDEELKVRQDAVTRVAHAYAAFYAGKDATAELKVALETGILDPRALFQAGVITKDPALLKRALAMGPGLLPSERAAAEAALGGAQPPK